MENPQEMSTSFGAVASTYEVGRPEYPLEAVEWMLQPVSGPDYVPRVADVGAGTGKLTRALTRLGAAVVAIDPDAEMLETLHGVLPDVPTRVGNAESVPLPTASVDAVVLGQAWHWVEPVSGSKECARVIRPGGVLGLIWNIRDESVDWVNRLGDIMRGSAAERMLATGDPPLHEPFGDMESARWKWVRPMNRDGLMDMARSRSYVITASRAERARIEAGLSTLLDELGLEGGASIKFPYTTRAYRAIRPCDDPL